PALSEHTYFTVSLIVEYQFNPTFFQTTVTAQILLKALTNLPHADFTLCKCMIDQAHQEERPIRQILYLGELLETCHFQSFWQALAENMEVLDGITGFKDSVRKCVHLPNGGWGDGMGTEAPPPDAQLMVWMSKYGWMEPEPGQIFICNQEESIKPKNIVKIDFDSGCWGMGRHPTHTPWGDTQHPPCSPPSPAGVSSIVASSL
uniref:CSN8/PSMD8/EIF3K domain-containing protein n=1 Tax=Accipiter nisus TaxID=211598 RepID=A0A8B9MY37_9AVES